MWHLILRLRQVGQAGILCERYGLAWLVVGIMSAQALGFASVRMRRGLVGVSIETSRDALDGRTTDDLVLSVDCYVVTYA